MEHKETIENNGMYQINAFTEIINPQKEPLTVEKIKTFKDFENVTDEEALEIIYTIDTLCRITQEYLMNQNRNENTNPLNIVV